MWTYQAANRVLDRKEKAIREVRELARGRPDLDEDEWEAIWARCWHRIRHWQVPARWSAREWRAEARAEGLLAACQAGHDFDPARGVPRDAFFYQRMLARVWSRYRREWTYGRHLRAPLSLEDYPTPDDPSPASDKLAEVARLLGRLNSRDCWLIRQLFWVGKTEAAVASDLGISQQAVSQRKSHALKLLQHQAAELQQTADASPL